MATHRLRPDLNTGTIQQAVIDAVNANYPAGDSLFSCGTVQYLLDTIKEKDHDNEVLNRVVDKLGARIIELEGSLREKNSALSATRALLQEEWNRPS